MTKHYTPLSLVGAALLAVTTVSPASQHETPGREGDKTTAQDVRQEMSDVTEAFKSYTADKRDEAAAKAKAALDAMDARIAALESSIVRNWEKMDQAAREQARNTMTGLRKQRIEAAEWYGSMKNGTAEAWEHTKKGFADAYDSLRRASTQAEKDYQEAGKKKP